MSELDIVKEYTTSKAMELLSSSMSLRDRIANLDAFLSTQPNVTIEPTHTFIDGMYSREIVFEEGTIATGSNHKTPQMDVMLEGEMLVATNEGYKHLVAPMTFTTLPGERKAGIALKRTRWISYHATECTTVEDVEAEIIAPGYEELEPKSESDLADNADYLAMLEEYGATEGELKRQHLGELVVLPVETVRVGMSSIHGVGLFSYMPLVEGQIIAASHLGNYLTIAGRYVNHSATPNADVEVRGENVFLVAKQTLTPEDEITINYRKINGGTLCQ